MSQIFRNIVKDIKVDLDDEFDRNFERKAFFDKPWSQTKHQNSRGSLLMRSGFLRSSLSSEEYNAGIRWTSSMPYASIHNEGGEIIVTAKMKSFFWAMYYKSSGAVSGKGSTRDVRLNEEAAKWKNMALMKVGQRMKIEQRQFIGSHPKVRQIINKVLTNNASEINEYVKSKLKR